MAAASWRRKRTGTTPGAAEAHFPRYDVLAHAPAWDEETRAVVLARVARPGPLRFFEVRQEPTARALVDRLLAQDEEPRVPVLEVIDRRLLAGQGDGYRYAGMPDDRQAWIRSLDALDTEARAGTGRPFADLGRFEQIELLERIRTLDGDWYGLPAGRVFELWMRYACAAFYAHPWAWNEIGFGGPAYPRGYANLGLGRREHWEEPERDTADPLPWAQRIERVRKADGPR